MILSCNPQSRKNFRIPVPVSEHLPVCVTPVHGYQRRPVQALPAYGIQISDILPAFLQCRMIEFIQTHFLLISSVMIIFVFR
jgi:hypothetical protein